MITSETIVILVIIGAVLVGGIGVPLLINWVFDLIISRRKKQCIGILMQMRLKKKLTSLTSKAFAFFIFLFLNSL